MADVKILTETGQGLISGHDGLLSWAERKKGTADGMSFNVIQHFAKVAFTLFDLLRAERLFEDVSVHGASPS
jgi:hypothetical protein